MELPFTLVENNEVRHFYGSVPDFYRDGPESSTTLVTHPPGSFQLDPVI